jgi:hypothetical protein
MSEPDNPPRRFLPQPIETTSTKSNRRFAVEPVETSTRSVRGKDEGKQQSPSSKSEAPVKRRFAPQLVETSIKSSRGSPVRPTPELTPEPSPITSEAEYDSKSRRPRRRFTPQLIETTKRSKRADTLGPATLPIDKTDITPGTNHIYLPRVRSTPSIDMMSRISDNPSNTPLSSSLPYMSYLSHPPLMPPRRQGSMKPHLNTRRSTRQNSFQPELEAILSDDASDESPEESFTNGLHTPAFTSSFGSDEEAQDKLKTRESCDERFSGYLLELAAKAAEKQLREQAEAAYPNSDFHVPPEHFYDRESDTSSDDGESTFGVGLLPHEMLGAPPQARRKSTEVGWAAREMQQHQEHLARLREEETQRMVAAEASNPAFGDPFWTNGMTVKGGPILDKEKEAELQRMRNAASPPMLGGDLVFRKCPSPKATKFETDQRIDVAPKRSEKGGGLWGGFCVADDDGQYISPVLRGPPLLHTPANEREDLFSMAFGNEVNAMRSRPGTPNKNGVHMLPGLEERLNAEAKKANRSKLEETIEQEFDDRFVTQVYNYLSLGYPSLARAYDDELSKISRIPVDELCQDDNLGAVAGHIGLEDGETVPASTRCARWTALRSYILEWARQHPDMDNEAASPRAWGVRARRGSWAI